MLFKRKLMHLLAFTTLVGATFGMQSAMARDVLPSELQAQINEEAHQETMDAYNLLKSREGLGDFAKLRLCDTQNKYKDNCMLISRDHSHGLEITEYKVYENGRAQKLLQIHAQNGVVLKETVYQNNLKEGVLRQFHTDGSPAEFVQYHLGKREGEGVWFLPDGTKLLSIVFKKDNPVSGKCANGEDLDEFAIYDFLQQRRPPVTCLQDN